MKFMKWAVIAVFVTACWSVLTDARAQNATLQQNSDDTQGTSGLYTFYGFAVAATDNVAYVSLPDYHPASSNVVGHVAIYKPNTIHTTWQRTGWLDLASTVRGDGPFGLGLAAQSTATTNWLAVTTGSMLRLYSKTGSNSWQKVSAVVLPAGHTAVEFLVWGGDTIAVTVQEFRDVNHMNVPFLAVDLYHVNASHQLQFVQTLNAPKGSDDQLWGSNNVSIDGRQMVIGAPRNSPGTGSVQLYSEASDGTWHAGAIVQAPNTSALSFGEGVAIRNSKLVVGAPDEGTVQNGSTETSGAAYVYVLVGGQWTVTQHIRPDLDTPQVGPADHFGQYVRINDGFAGISAPKYISASNEGNFGVYSWQGNQLALSNWLTPRRMYNAADLGDRYLILGDVEDGGHGVAQIMDLQP